MPSLDHPRLLPVPDVLSVGLILGALGALGRFFQIDQRPPMDLGHYFEALPEAWRALGRFDVLELLDLILHTGGPYNVGLALLARVFGRSPLLLEGIEFLWLGMLLLATWGVARRLGGRWAGLAAVALCTAMPVVHSQARSHWIHLPEAALLMAALWLWMRDPALAKRSVRVGLLVVLSLAFTLRPTALLFGGPLLLLTWRSAEPRSRAWLPALSLIPAVLVLLPTLPEYIEGKAMIREVYADMVRPLLPSLVEHAFVLPLILATVGLILLAVLAPARIKEPALWLLAGWVLLGLALCAFFNVGPDNFPLLFLGAAMLAGLGLSIPGERRWAPWARAAVGAALTACSGLAVVLPFLLGHLALPFSGVYGWALVSEEPQHYLRPQVEVLTLDFVWPLLDEVCVNADDSCTVLVTRGLVNFNREDDLNLATFLLRRDGITFHNAGQFFFEHNIESEDALEGLMVLDCPHAVPEPDNLFTEREGALEAMIEHLDVAFVHQIGAPLRCSFRVFRLEEEDPQAALKDFWLRYPWVYSGPKDPPPPGSLLPR